MSELKFECPFCGQHIAAERLSAGFRFPCPTCHEEICVPMDENPFAGSEAAQLETPLTERERQIAEARKAHPVSLYPTMKPRLSYILNGELAESDLKPQTGPEQKDPVPDPANPDIKTLNE